MLNKQKVKRLPLKSSLFSLCLHPSTFHELEPPFLFPHSIMSTTGIVRFDTDKTAREVHSLIRKLLKIAMDFYSGAFEKRRLNKDIGNAFQIFICEKL